MATTEHNGLMVYKDKDGNNYVLYPITKAELVDGLDDLLDAKANSTDMTNLLAQKAALVHAARHAADGADPITPEAIGAALANLSNVPAASIQAAITAAGGARVEVKSYTGTGTYGSDNPNSVTFDGVPFMVIIAGMPASGQMYPVGLFFPASLLSSFPSKGPSYASLASGGSLQLLATNYAKFSGTTLSWYATTNAQAQLNVSDKNVVCYAFYA